MISVWQRSLLEAPWGSGEAPHFQKKLAAQKKMRFFASSLVLKGLLPGVSPRLLVAPRAS